MKISILSLGMILLLNLTLLGQNSDARYSGEFLENPVGVRASGMGGAFVAVADDGSSFFYNPAGVAVTPGILLSTFYASQFGSISDPLSNYFYTGYSHNFKELGSISVNWIRLSIDDIHQYGQLVGFNSDLRFTSLTGVKSNGSTFNNNQDAFFLNYAMEFKPKIDFGWMFFKVPYRVPIGVNLKYIRESFGGKVNYAGSGFGADFGIMIINNVNDYFSNKVFGDLTFGLTIKDFTNTIVTWNSVDKKQFKIPLSTAWGFSYRQPLPMMNLSAIASYQRTTNYKTYSNWGSKLFTINCIRFA